MSECHVSECHVSECTCCSTSRLLMTGAAAHLLQCHHAYAPLQHGLSENCINAKCNAKRAFVGVHGNAHLGVRWHPPERNVLQKACSQLSWLTPEAAM